MVALPILLPSLIALIIFRLSLDARKSRSRIKLLESQESYGERLVNAVAHMEKRVEDAVIDYIDETGTGAVGEADTSGDSSSVKAATQSQLYIEAKSDDAEAQGQPGLTELQKKLVKSLNTIPRLKKELAYIHPVLNSHAVIIARDVKRFEHHKQGQGVLQHIADNFVM